MHKYPKILLLTASFLLAYVLYQEGVFDVLPGLLQGYGYLTLFFAGLLFSFGFTTPFAIVLFVELAPTVHPIPAAVVAGFGALISDECIFRFVRVSFEDEFKQLRRTPTFRYLRSIILHKHVSTTVQQYLLWSVAGVVIASPLPDEVGVTLLSGITNIDNKRFALICYGFNTIGILLILLMAGGV